jgi:hypothetical protein
MKSKFYLCTNCNQIVLKLKHISKEICIENKRYFVLNPDKVPKQVGIRVSKKEEEILSNEVDTLVQSISDL